MSYRNHSFARRHLLREFDSSLITVTDSAGSPVAEDPDYPVRRLYDNITRRVWRSTIQGEVNISAQIMDVNAGQVTFNPTRLFVGQQNARTRLTAYMPQVFNVSSQWVDLPLTTYGVMYLAPTHGQVLDASFDALVLSAGFRLEILPTTLGMHEIGELQWTESLAPTSGIVQEWAHPPRTDVVTVQAMESGAEFITKHGNGGRQFTVSHQGVDGVELEGYDALFADVGQSEPFWYDHSDSGDRVETLQGLNESAELTTATGGSWGESLLPPVSGLGAMSAYVSDNQWLTVNPPEAFDAPRDFSNSLMSLDVMLEDTSQLDIATLSLRLYSDGAQGDWLLSDVLDAQRLDDKWFRVFVDIELGPDAGFVDTTRLLSWALVYGAAAGGIATHRIHVSNLLHYRKSKAATRSVFTQAPTRVQDNKVPNSSFGPSYTLGMSMREVLT